MKVEIRNSILHSKGLFATEKIKKGEVVVAWQPKVITKDEATELPEDEREHYLYPDGEKLLWMQPPERYINHSCNPNTYVVGKSDVASRDIEAGEEITSDYVDLETENFICNCGAANCKSLSEG